MISENDNVEIIRRRFVAGEIIELIIGTAIALYEDEYPEERDERGVIERNAIPFWVVRLPDGTEKKEKTDNLRKIRETK